MQDTLGPVTTPSGAATYASAPGASLSPRAIAPPAMAAPVMTPARITFAAVWRDTFTTLSARPAPVLAAALIGFALTSIVGTLVGVVLTVDNYTRTNMLFTSFGLNRTVPLVVQALMGVVLSVLARGVIAWLSLDGVGRYAPQSSLTNTKGVGSFYAGLRAALSRAPMLLIAALFTGGLFFLGNLGLYALLLEFRIDVSEVGNISLTLDGTVRSILLRILNTVLPDPGSPFTEWLAYIRLETSRVSTTLVYAGGMSFYRVKNVQSIPLPWLLGGASVILLPVVDVLLRFVPAALMRGPAGWGVRQAIGAMRLSFAHFGVVLAHLWLVRLVILVGGALFLIVPQMLVQNMLLPQLIRSLGGPWVYLVSSLLISISLALVSMVFVAFSIVYETRLYAALADKSDF